MNSTNLNSTNLYIATTQLILKCNHKKPETWQELYRLLPYLRNSLCCVVCNNLVVDPLTPSNSSCQHHVCKNCRGGRKKIKPACTWCKDLIEYSENKSLRILLQCYKHMCMMLTRSTIYKSLIEEASKIMSPIAERGCGLISMIQEGSCFKDDYNNQAGLLESAYSILPCVFSSNPNVANVTKKDNKQTACVIPPNAVRTLSNGTAMYSVLYAGNGNKITIKRKEESVKRNAVPLMTQIKKEPAEYSQPSLFKKPPQVSNKSVLKVRRGCRCGNATATPGKLTCCGQRCPCYVESKPCTECRCRGCRNPHRPDGMKVIPHIPEISNLRLQLTQQRLPRDLQTTNLHFAGLEGIQLDQLKPFKSTSLDSFSKVSNVLPQTIFMDDPNTDDEDEEIEVDV